MRTFASIILIILVVPLFLIGVLAATVKFQLLTPKFWEDAFNKNNVYAGITDVVKKALVDETVKGGGKASEIGLITDLITPLNVKDFINNNLGNVLNYANGKVKELLVYIPVGRAPKGFLPKNFENLPETMPIGSLLEKLNIEGVTRDQIQYISLVGPSLNYLLIIDAILFLLFILFLFLLTPAGSRFIGPGISLALSGLSGIGLYFGANQTRLQIAKDFTGSSETVQRLLGIITPPVLGEVSKVWLIAGLAAVLIGIIVIFIKKPRTS